MHGSHCDTSSWRQILFTAVNSSAYFIDISRIFLPWPSRREKKSFPSMSFSATEKVWSQKLKAAPFCKARPWHCSKVHNILGTRCAGKNSCFHFYNTASQQKSFTYIISFESNNNPVRSAGQKLLLLFFRLGNQDSNVTGVIILRQWELTKNGELGAHNVTSRAFPQLHGRQPCKDVGQILFIQDFR